MFLGEQIGVRAARGVEDVLVEAGSVVLLFEFLHGCRSITVL